MKYAAAAAAGRAGRAAGTRCRCRGRPVARGSARPGEEGDVDRVLEQQRRRLGGHRDVAEQEHALELDRREPLHDRPLHRDRDDAIGPAQVIEEPSHRVLGHPAIDGDPEVVAAPLGGLASSTRETWRPPAASAPRRCARLVRRSSGSRTDVRDPDGPRTARAVQEIRVSRRENLQHPRINLHQPGICRRDPAHHDRGISADTRPVSAPRDDP